MGSCGVQIENHGADAILLAYFEAGEERDVPASAVESLLEKYGLTNTGMAVSDVPREDWEADWRQFFSPIWPTPNIVVHPSWIPVEIDSSQIAIVIDPKMAFGTGEHESTQLCLQILEETVRPETRCLDLGTGSGILAIAAARLGAHSIRAVDTDPDAIHNARENVVRNGIPASVVKVIHGDIRQIEGETFDLVVGNIQSSVLRPMLTTIVGCLVPGGRSIFSGLLAAERQPFCEAVDAAGLRVIDVRVQGNWISVCAQAPI